MGRSIDTLSDEERIAYYRMLALEALKNAREAAGDQLKAGYLDIARHWSMVADDVERLTRRQAEPVSRFPELRKNGNAARL